MADHKPRVRITDRDGRWYCDVAVPVRKGWAIERAVVYSTGYLHAAPEIWRQIIGCIRRAQKAHGVP
jgi:hypothetical protein